MQPPNTDHIEFEIQYPQYKIVVITMLMSICGMLGTFYVFSVQEKQQFTEFKKEVQVAKQLQMTDMQDHIHSYSALHNKENLQSALPVLFSKHTELKLNGDIKIKEKIIATQFQEQQLDLYVLDGELYVQVDDQKSVLSLPILLQELQELGLWIYGIQFTDEEAFIKENPIQAQIIDSSNKKSMKKNQSPIFIKVFFEYPLPKWSIPTIFSEDEFLKQSFDVLAFLAYWEKFQKIRQDEKLIVLINHHLHGMMWEDEKKEKKASEKANKEGKEKNNEKRTFHRHKVFDEILLSQHETLTDQNGLTDKTTNSNLSQIQ